MAADNPTMLLLKGAVALGLPAAVLGHVIAAFPQDPPIPIAVLRYTFGPIVVHVNHKGETRDLGWLTQDIVKEWRPRIDLERLEILSGERPDLVSPAELWLVMYNAIMAGRLHHAIEQIYLWAAIRACLASGRQLPEGLFPAGSNAAYDCCPTDAQVLDGFLTGEYRMLCRTVIARVIAGSTLEGPSGRRRSAAADMQKGFFFFGSIPGVNAMLGP
jgi:hypothetical protein